MSAANTPVNDLGWPLMKRTATNAAAIANMVYQT
jgi:hypothetical protein